MRLHRGCNILQLVSRAIERLKKDAALLEPHVQGNKCVIGMLHLLAERQGEELEVTNEAPLRIKQSSFQVSVSEVRSVTCSSKGAEP